MSLFFGKPVICNTPAQSMGDFSAENFTPRERMNIKNCSTLFINMISRKNCFFSFQNHRSFHRFRFQLCESTNTYLNLVLETSVWGPDLSQTSRPPTLLLPSMFVSVLGRVFQIHVINFFIARILSHNKLCYSK